MTTPAHCGHHESDDPGACAQEGPHIGTKTYENSLATDHVFGNSLKVLRNQMSSVSNIAQKSLPREGFAVQDT